MTRCNNFALQLFVGGFPFGMPLWNALQRATRLRSQVAPKVHTLTPQKWPKIGPFLAIWRVANECRQVALAKKFAFEREMRKN